jgi:hypothetical protein
MGLPNMAGGTGTGTGTGGSKGGATPTGATAGQVGAPATSAAGPGGKGGTTPVGATGGPTGVPAFLGAPATAPLGNPGSSLATNVKNAYDAATAGYGANVGYGKELMDKGLSGIDTGMSLYGNSADMGGNMFDRGGKSLGQGTAYGGDAASTFRDMAGYTPEEIRAKSLANTNLDPYMNPYTKSVINTTMGKLNRQEAGQQQAIDDSSAAQNAFGGSRMYVQKANENKNFDELRAQTMAGLNAQNFGQAQQAGQFDINSKLKADLANQGMNANLMSGGAQGLGSLASIFSGLGANLLGSGAGTVGNAAGGMGNLASNVLGTGGSVNRDALGGLSQQANFGFGMGQDLQKNQMASGEMQRQLNQSIIDAIKGQTGGATGAGGNALMTLISSLPGIGTAGKTETQNNPGIMGVLGPILGLFGA